MLALSKPQRRKANSKAYNVTLRSLLCFSANNRPILSRVLVLPHFKTQLKPHHPHRVKLLGIQGGNKHNNNNKYKKKKKMREVISSIVSGALQKISLMGLSREV